MYLSTVLECTVCTRLLSTTGKLLLTFKVALCALRHMCSLPLCVFCDSLPLVKYLVLWKATDPYNISENGLKVAVEKLWKQLFFWQPPLCAHYGNKYTIINRSAVAVSVLPPIRSRKSINRHIITANMALFASGRGKAEASSYWLHIYRQKVYSM